MLEREIASDDQGIKYTTLPELAKGIDQKILFDFALKFMEKHKYLKSKTLSYAYLSEYYNLTPTSMDYIEILKILKYKFRTVIRELINVKKVVAFNSQTYTRIKQKEIPEKKMVRLIYHNGSFRNPKFYD